MTKRQQIFSFLRAIQKNNDREWFKAHRADFEQATATFHMMIAETIRGISAFDPTISGVSVESTTYRFYRDTRFSEDKSPYKTHLGAYINPYGTKSLHSGYYLHLEPNNSGVGCGPYWLPMNVLTAIRNDIVLRTETFHTILQHAPFKASFSSFGRQHLKTLPKGFSRDYPFPEYLRAKDYTLWYALSDDFFEREDWCAALCEKFSLMKPFMDFINETIDDYI